MLTICFILSASAIAVEENSIDKATLDDYNIIWDSPSEDESGSMPLGNGDIGLNVWMEDGGDLVFYISKTDSWGDNGRLLKVGRVRVSLSPNPLAGRTAYRQELNLQNGEMTIDIEGDNPMSLSVWVDANHPVVHVETKSSEPVTATAKVEIWRDEQMTRAVQVANPYSQDPAGRKTIAEPDMVVEDYPDGVAWYHRNIKSVGPEMTMKFQGLDDYPGFEDPLLGRTFGAVMKGSNAEHLDDTTLQCSGKENRLSVYVLTKHPSTKKQWLQSMNRMIAEIENVPASQRFDAHCKWWHDFWDRSWIIAKSGRISSSPLIPANDHAVMIGADQHGGNKFDGEIGRVSFFEKPLSDDRIKQIAAGSPIQDSAVSYTEADARKVPDSAKWGSGNVSFEVRFKPGNSRPARLVDKITPGGSDGLLLDTYPGNGLRLIVGSTILAVSNCLEPNEWAHAAAVINSDADNIKLFLNGELVATAEATEQLDEASAVTRAYILQRFIDACGSRGRYPVKFNGSIFTVAYGDDPDDRRWGQGYWWQNSRLPYISMPMSGDFDLMRPLFRMYDEDIFPLCQYRTKKYFGFEGAYFPECMYPWGAVFSQTYGWDKPFGERKDPLQRSMWHKWEWVCGPELVFMMMDYCDYTQDYQYMNEKVIPIAEAIMSFFENYYKSDDGKLVMHPSQACETWIECTNPMPEVAGLRGMTKRLIGLPEDVASSEQRNRWRAFLAKLPEIPTRETEDGKALAPAEKFAKKINVENPELYAVFPFRHISLEKPNVELGINALKHRWDKGSSGWRQDDIFMAYLGLTDQAKSNIVSRARNYDKNSRFPAFWGPNYDWVPDQDHGGVLMKAFQSMLMQVDPYSDKIYLLPAWPKDWDVKFKLHAPYKTVIRGRVVDGNIEELAVTPSFRRQDVEILD